jgi:monoamine oxidase
MVLPVAIIGAGFAGLHAARLLHEAGVGFRIFEARDRLDGRIFSADAAGRPAEDGFDLGPSWFWPGMHPAIAATVAELGLAAFPQHDEGDGLVARLPHRPPKRLAGFRQESRSMRLTGGTAVLVRALAAGLPEGSIHLGTQVTAILLDGDHARLTLRQGDGRTESVAARQVIAALPPRASRPSLGDGRWHSRDRPRAVARAERHGTEDGGHPHALCERDRFPKDQRRERHD